MGFYHYQTAQEAVNCPRVAGQFIFNSRELANAKVVASEDRRWHQQTDYLKLAQGCIVDPDDIENNTSDHKDYFVARLSDVMHDISTTPDF